MGMRTLGAILMTIFPLSSIAEDLPRFDGVYLGMKDGGFVKLNSFSGTHVVVIEEEPDYYLPVPKIPQGGVPQKPVLFMTQPKIVDEVMIANEGDVLNAGFFDLKNLESIFVRSRTLRIKFVETVTVIQDFYEVDAAITRIREDSGAERLLPEYFTAFVGANCGKPADRMNLLNDSENTFQYFLEGSGLVDTNGLDVTKSARFDECGKTSDILRSYGLMIRTTEGDYLIMEVDALSDYYIPYRTQSWPEGSLAELNRKVLDARQ